MSFLNLPAGTPSNQVVVKVFFTEEQLQKAMSFDPSSKVADARNAIIEKRQETNPIRLGVNEQLLHYGLFAPPTANASGQWMRDTDTLNDYNIGKTVCVHCFSVINLYLCRFLSFTIVPHHSISYVIFSYDQPHCSGMVCFFCNFDVSVSSSFNDQYMQVLFPVIFFSLYYFD